MSPFRGGLMHQNPSSSSSSLDDGRRRKEQEQEHNAAAAAACDVASGDCYLRFPWYFPVSEVLRQNVFIPVPCYSSSDVQRGQDLQLILSSAPFTSTDDGHGNGDAAAAAVGGVESKLRMVRVVLHGPSHMNLIIRDNSSGSRLKRWSYFGGGDDSVLQKTAGLAAAVDTHHHHRPVVIAVSLEVSADDDRLVRVLKKTETETTTTPPSGGALPGHHRVETIHLHVPPPVRVEGIHFLQIGFGLCRHHQHHHHRDHPHEPHHDDNTCSTVMHMLVEGDAPIDIAAYGHHTDVPLTTQLQLLQHSLPDWAKGAEWTNFPSHLIRDVI